MEKLKKKIIIATGGTGGHVISGLVVAERLIALGHNVTWIGTKYRIEYELVRKNNIIIDFIDIKSFNNYKFLGKFIFIFYLFKSIFQSFKILSNRKPDIIFGMGNYISFPSCLAAWFMNIPIIIHEQNSVVGLTNKFLYLLSSKFLSGFNIDKNLNYIYTGNPIRNSILSIKHYSLRVKNKKGPLNILVLGGSQGSEFINFLIIKLIKKLNISISIWHQTGKKNKKIITNMYYKYLINSCLYRIEEFINNISIAYEWADLVISRSGALTVSELIKVGVPAIFIPFVHNDKHQFYNALILKINKSAIILNQNFYDIDLIANYLNNLNRKILFKMSINTININNINPVYKIIYEILNINNNVIKN